MIPERASRKGNYREAGETHQKDLKRKLRFRRARGRSSPTMEASDQRLLED